MANVFSAAARIWVDDQLVPLGIGGSGPPSPLRRLAACPSAPPGPAAGGAGGGEEGPAGAAICSAGRGGPGLVSLSFSPRPGRGGSVGASGGVSREVSSAREKPETWGSAAVTGFCGLKIPLIYDELVMSSEFFFFPYLFIYFFNHQRESARCSGKEIPRWSWLVIL